jgi:hypothetical protein
MATTWKTIAVRVERPPEVALAKFFADMRSWLDHQCIIPAEFRGVTLADQSGVFDVLFDNPRDACLFGRRFAAQPALCVSARWPTSDTEAAIDQGRASILAAIADGFRGALWPRTKLLQRAPSATM